MEGAAAKGNNEAAANLGRIYSLGVQDHATERMLLQPNNSLAMYYVNKSINNELPMGYHTFAEIIHYNLVTIPETFVTLYNLTQWENKCEVSVNFYAKSILRGYLKSWLNLAEKRYRLQDFEGSYLLYAYSSFLGLPLGAFSAGHSWENLRTGAFTCKLSSPLRCATFYYLHGMDYFKSLARLGDIISFKDSTI